MQSNKFAAMEGKRFKRVHHKSTSKQAQKNKSTADKQTRQQFSLISNGIPCVLRKAKSFSNAVYFLLCAICH